MGEILSMEEISENILSPCENKPKTTRKSSKSQKRKTKTVNNISKSRSPGRKIKAGSCFKNGDPHFLLSTASTRCKSVSKSDSGSMKEIPRISVEEFSPKKIVPKKRNSEPVNKIDAFSLEKYQIISLKNIEACQKLMKMKPESIKKN